MNSRLALSASETSSRHREGASDGGHAYNLGFAPYVVLGLKFQWRFEGGARMIRCSFFCGNRISLPIRLRLLLLTVRKLFSTNTLSISRGPHPCPLTLRHTALPRGQKQTSKQTNTPKSTKVPRARTPWLAAAPASVAPYVDGLMGAVGEGGTCPREPVLQI